MMCAGVSAQLLREPRDDVSPTSNPVPIRPFRDAWQRLRDDRRLRRLCLTAVLFIFSQIIFPHYQALGASLPNYTPACLMDWVIAQHIGASIFSGVSGMLADRFGTRSALRLLMACAVLAPLLALGLSTLETLLSPITPNPRPRWRRKQHETSPCDDRHDWRTVNP